MVNSHGHVVFGKGFVASFEGEQPEKNELDENQHCCDIVFG